MAFRGGFSDATSPVRAANESIRNYLMALRAFQSKMERVEQRQKVKIDSLRAEQEEVEAIFNEKKLVIAVTGATSAGKSTVINTLVRQDLLFTAAEHCTPCSVSIETSADITEAFVTVGKPSDSNKKLPVSDLRTLSDAKSKNQSKDPLYVCLPHDDRDEGVFRVPNLRIVDSPGLYEKVDKDSVDIEGDAFVFVVDFDSGVKWDELEKKLKETKGRMQSWKAVFFVYNRCDLVEKEGKERFEQGKCEKLKKATDFLKENNVYTDDSTAKEKIFFLSAYSAWMARQYKASVQRLIQRSVKCRSSTTTIVLLVCGGSEVGKTTLCDDLCGNSRNSADVWMVKKCSLHEVTEMEIKKGDCSDDVDRRSRVCKTSQQTIIAVVDSPNKGEVREWIASNTLQSTVTVLAVVIDGTDSLKKMQEKIAKQLQLCPDGNENRTEVFLIITKMNEKSDSKGSDTALQEKKEIREYWRTLKQSEDNVFFMEKDELMDQYEEAFSEFERQVVEAAAEKHVAIKLKRIEVLIEKLKKRTLKKARGKVKKLEELQHAFSKIADNLSIAAKQDDLQRRRSIRAVQFIKESQVDVLKLMEDGRHMEEMFDKFIDFCKKQVGADFEEIIKKATKHLQDIDLELKESAKNFLLSELERLLQLKSGPFDFSGLVQRVKSLIPSLDVEADEQKLQELKKQKKKISEECLELETLEKTASSQCEVQNQKLEQRKANLEQSKQQCKVKARTQSEWQRTIQRKEQNYNEKKTELQEVRQARRDVDKTSSGMDNWHIAAGAVSGIHNRQFASDQQTKTDVALSVTSGLASGLENVLEKRYQREEMRRNNAFEEEKSMKQEKAAAAQDYDAAVSQYDAARRDLEELEEERDAITKDVEQVEAQLRQMDENFSKLSSDKRKKFEEEQKIIEDLKEKKQRVQEGKKDHEIRKENFRQDLPKQLQREIDEITNTVHKGIIAASKDLGERENVSLKNEEEQFKMILSDIENLRYSYACT